MKNVCALKPLTAIGTASLLSAGLLLSLAAPAKAGVERVPDQLIVGFKKDVPQSEQKQIISRGKGKRRRMLGRIRAGVVKPKSGIKLSRLLRALRRNKDVAYVERDIYLDLLKTPNDSLFSLQYGLTESSGSTAVDIDATNAWDIKTKCAKVAVLDTGVDTDHPDLKDNLWKNSKETSNNGKDDDGNGYIDDVYGADMIDGRGSGEDANGHGTHVAGIIAADSNNSSGVSGICWSGNVMSVRFMDATGRGTLSGVLAALEYAVDKGAKVINASFGTTSKSESLDDAIGDAKDKGVLVVVAAGNESTDVDKDAMYPCAYTHGNILCVGASTSSDTLASFSNYGDKRVDMAAPGESILSTYLSNSYKELSGTSMAAPYVAGAAGLLRAKDSKASYKEIRAALRDNVDESSAFKNKILREGRLNLARSLGEIADDTKAPDEFSTTSPDSSFSLGSTEVVTFSWNATSDKSGIIDYEVYVDGSLVGTTSDPDGKGSGTASTTFSASISAGSHSWYVKARDVYQTARKSS